MNQELTTGILLAVFLFCAIGLILIAVWMYTNGPSSKMQQRITRFVDTPVDESKVTPPRASTLMSKQNLAKFRDWINVSLRGFSSEKLKLKLSSAYWTITDTEYILIRIVAPIAAFILGWSILRNIMGGIFLAAITIIVPPMLVDQAIAKRQKKFGDQLLDVLTLITGAVKSGYSLMQAFDLAVKEIPAPASEEFGRVLREIRFGISLEGTLFNLVDRMASDDMKIVATAIIINSQIGGNLSTVLDSTISTIRDRMQLMGEIRSLSSYAKYVGNFLSLMPFIIGLILFLLKPDYFATVNTSRLTQVILGVALVGVLIGNIWVRRIVKIEV